MATEVTLAKLEQMKDGATTTELDDKLLIEQMSAAVLGMRVMQCSSSACGSVSVPLIRSWTGRRKRRWSYF